MFTVKMTNLFFHNENKMYISSICCYSYVAFHFYFMYLLQCKTIVISLALKVRDVIHKFVRRFG